MEGRRRAEVDAARAAGLPLPAFCRPAGRFPELRISLDDVDVTEDPGGASAHETRKRPRARARARIHSHQIAQLSQFPHLTPDLFPRAGPELPTPRGQSARPPPGVYARGAHTVAVAPEALAAAPPGGRPRDKKSAEALNKKIELALEELGVRPPVTATRAVCRAWYALRSEVAALLELRSHLARKAKEPAAAAAAQAAAAAAAGGSTPRTGGGMGGGMSNAYFGGGADGGGGGGGVGASPKAWQGAGGAPGSASGPPGSPGDDGEDGRAAKREHKRKAPSRCVAAAACAVRCSARCVRGGAWAVR